ncbi:unnamed protein product [Protopolystoma xenopodis]|uniref:Uncharacterized protein n=1 Tax=Protopolystoma xenopodis TaxID=117903 RepID=A0A3S5FFJ0_9PLAT|nr:unnamed protein product [Protopolystoma xenopodis]
MTFNSPSSNKKFVIESDFSAKTPIDRAPRKGDLVDFFQLSAQKVRLLRSLNEPLILNLGQDTQPNWQHMLQSVGKVSSDLKVVRRSIDIESLSCGKNFGTFPYYFIAQLAKSRRSP